MGGGVEVHRVLSCGIMRFAVPHDMVDPVGKKGVGHQFQVGDLFFADMLPGPAIQAGEGFGGNPFLAR